MKILIHALDDEQIVLDWLEHLFSDPVYDLHVFSDAKEFEDAFNGDVDLVITDMRVPGYDLFATLKKFKTIKRGVYLIVISGYFDDEIYERLFELDVDRVIKKGSDLKWMFKIENYVNDLFPRIRQRAEILQ